MSISAIVYIIGENGITTLSESNRSS